MSDVRLRWDGGKLQEGVRRATVKALRDTAEDLLTEANKTVPLRDGDLMRSGLADVDEQALEASVSYGHGPAAPYAVVQHERTDFRHSEGRRAKWLELALDENRARYQRYIADQIRKALRG